jgi:hypothetical protein
MNIPFLSVRADTYTDSEERQKGYGSDGDYFRALTLLPPSMTTKRIGVKKSCMSRKDRHNRAYLTYTIPGMHDT